MWWFIGGVTIGKARAACAQSFALWQQTTIDIMRGNHSTRTLIFTFNCSHVSIGRACTPRSLYYCLFAPHIRGVVLRAHPVRGESHNESHNQRNSNREVATVVCYDYWTILVSSKILKIFIFKKWSSTDWVFSEMEFSRLGIFRELYQ